MLNTAVAEELRQFADELEGAEDFEAALMALIKREITAHKRIIFNGNGYDESWVVEAEKRGLLNLKSAADAFPHYVDQKNLDLFAKHNVYTAAEMQLPYGDPARGVQQDPAHRGSDHERHGTRGDHSGVHRLRRASLQPPSTAKKAAGVSGGMEAGLLSKVSELTEELYAKSASSGRGSCSSAVRRQHRDRALLSRYRYRRYGRCPCTG